MLFHMETVSTFQTYEVSATKIDTKITKHRSRRVRYFFVAMAIIFPILIAIGFGLDAVAISANQYEVHWFAYFHGAVMTLWLVVFLSQSILAAMGNLKFHRRLGLFSVGLGVFVWLSMVIATIRVFIAFPPPVDDFIWDTLLIQLEGIVLFGVFFTWGILKRNKAAVHKRLLFFSTLILVQAGIDRITFLPQLYSAFFVRFIYFDALIIPLLIYDFVTSRRIHRITMMGSMIIIIVQIYIALSAGTPAWHQFWFNRLAPFVEYVVEIKPTDAQIEPLLGDYGDKNWHMTVLREKDKVFLKLPDQPGLELGATSENEWFVKITAWKVSFIRDNHGKVTKIINRQPIKTWEAQRLK